MTPTLDQVIYTYRTNIEEGEEVIITLRDAMVKLFAGKEVPVDVIIEPTTEHIDTSLDAFLER